MKLPTISNESDSEETPLTLKEVNDETIKGQTFVRIPSHQEFYSSKANENLSKINLPKIPFAKMIFQWALLKKRKENFEKNFLKQLKNMTFGQFFGAEYEALREKLRKLFINDHTPFYFFSKTAHFNQPVCWIIKNINIGVKKKDDASNEEIESVVWNIDDMDLKVECILESSIFKVNNLLFELKTSLTDFKNILLQLDEKQSDYIYNCLNILIEKILSDCNLKNNATSDKKLEYDEKKIDNTGSNQNDLLEKEPNLIQDEDCLNIFSKNMSVYIEKLVKLGRKITGFVWVYRNKSNFLKDDINLDYLSQRNKALYHEELYKIAINRSPLRIFEIKETKEISFFNQIQKDSFLKTTVTYDSTNFMSRTSLFKEIQRNKHENLFMSRKLYQIKESIIESASENKNNYFQLFEGNNPLNLDNRKDFLNVEEEKDNALSPPRGFRGGDKFFSNILTESVLLQKSDANENWLETSNKLIIPKNTIINEKQRRNCLFIEDKIKNTQIYPEKPYDAEKDCETVFLNPFYEKFIFFF